MSQASQTVLLRGGLNLVSPPIAIPPGQASAAINYEPDVAGYTRVGGYERFDGRPRPSDSSDPVEIAARRAAIAAVPGTGPVRGVQVYDGHLYAFRDHMDGSARMYRDSTAGWQEMTFGSTLDFTAGTVEFLEGEVLVGDTSTATATINRVVLRTGAWGDGDAAGYLVLSNIDGTFQAEDISSTSGGAATIAADAVAISLAAGGYYDFTKHNFYGAVGRERLYGANGQGFAFEWSGEWLAPIRTGTAAGTLEDVSFVLAANGDFILAANGDSVILRAEFDRPIYIGQYQNHLFLAYDSGSLINSSVGEPLEYITTTGAAEVSFGTRISGLLSAAATALFIFGVDRIGYLSGNDSENFTLNPLTDSSGAFDHTAKMLDQPVYMDEGGVRSLATTSAYGGWRLGTLSQMIEPLLKAKRDAGVLVADTLLVRSKDQYRLFFDDGSGITIYLGRKQPEILPFRFPLTAFCACSGEIEHGYGDRVFVGATDGYVYEMDRGLSFDGAAVEAYIRLPFNSIGSPTINKRFAGLQTEVSCEDDIELGVTYDIDYASGIGGSLSEIEIEDGAPIISTELYDSVDWTEAVQGELLAELAGFGRNIAVTYISDSDDKRQHTLQSTTFRYAARGMDRRVR